MITDPSLSLASSSQSSAAPSLEALREHYRFLRLDDYSQREQLERFTGICALYGYEGFLRLQNAHVVIIGNGGVGSWVAEALCRTGVGTMTLVDMDDIELSNTNRQLHTLNSTLYHSKTSVLSRRLSDINPFVLVNIYQIMLIKAGLKEQLADILKVSPETLEAAQEPNLDLLPTPDELAASKLLQQEQKLRGEISGKDTGMTAAAQAALQISPHLYVVDAIDDLFTKACCLDILHRARVPVVTSGGAGGRIDPSHLHIGDVATAHGDQLIKRLRTELRRNYGYPKGDDALQDGNRGGNRSGRGAHSAKSSTRPAAPTSGAFKLLCSYSDESPRAAKDYAQIGLSPKDLGLGASYELPDLPSFGASMSVTASAGLLLASVIIRWIVGNSHA